MHLNPHFFRFIGLAAILWSCANLASAQEMPRYGIFVYSSFCKSAMSGDLYGSRITLRRLSDDDTIIYEYTDGSTQMVAADNLKLDSKSGKISFEIHAAGNLNAIVSGQFSGDGGSLKAHGLLFDEKATVTLSRIVNFAAP
ncbi:MAG TPA: hypothetical protein VNW52_11350, partial [Burkholderiaceae bacterium]|nr:hypothetical protein [Burkholderiaceae bacterium]